MDRSPFTFAAGRRAKWVVLAVWLLATFVAAGPAGLISKFEDALDNESTSFLPGDAESTAALEATEELQDGELAPIVIVYQRDSGLTPADREKIVADAATLTRETERFPGIVADGATAASGGNEAAAESDEGAAGGVRGPGCAGPTATVAGQPADYAPLVGPVCSPDGQAAIVLAYVKGDGEAETLLDPIDAWREAVSDPGGGLEVKITGGAAFSADAISIFESINGTLLLAAVSLVVFLLIVIYRSPFFFLIPVAAVLLAEVLSRSLGYGISEIGFTVNSQSSSIMSVLVLGAGTDYALLLVARYREELHREADRHTAMRTALASAGPTIFASATTVIAALLCLMLADVNGTAGLGPIGALGIFCAALSMLTLLPALLTIFGRRAFWPFVPHAPATAPRAEAIPAWSRRNFLEGGGLRALALVLGASLLLALPLALMTFIASLFAPFPLALLIAFSLNLLFLLLNKLLHALSDGSVPSLFAATLDRRVFTPYELRRHRAEHQVDATHGAWKRVGDWVARGPRRVMAGSVAVLAVLCVGWAFFSTDLTSNEGYRTEPESVEGQAILSGSFPSGATAPTDIVVADPGEVAAVREAVGAVPGVESVSEPVAAGEAGALVQATLGPDPYSTDAFDLVEPIREAAHRAEPQALVGGATAVEFDVREATMRDSIVIPPIVLLVVFLILIALLRALVAPLVLIGTVILSFAAALGVGYFAFEVIFDFAGSDPALPLFAFVFLVALGVDYNIFLIARAREEAQKHGTEQGVLRALAVTGGVITSAGIVLAGTFSVLATLPLVVLTEIGFVVAFGVLLDTFLVRSVLVPSIALTLGDRFWWPSALARRDTWDRSR